MTVVIDPDRLAGATAWPPPTGHAVQFTVNPTCQETPDEECEKHPTCAGCPADRPDPPGEEAWLPASPPCAGETRGKDPTTGGEKGRKLARFDLIPPRVLWDLAEHYGKGCLEHGGKYENRNWERGYPWSWSYAALQRHLTAWWSGEDVDAATGSNHLIAAAWHCCALAEYHRTHADKDDRPRLKN